MPTSPEIVQSVLELIHGRSVHNYILRCCRRYFFVLTKVGLLVEFQDVNMIRYDTRCYFNVRLKAGMSQLNLPHGKQLKSGKRKN